MTDQLFETGCRLCARSREACLVRLGGVHIGSHYCGDCHQRFGVRGIDSEITRRLAAQKVRGAKPQVGEVWETSEGSMVRVVRELDASSPFPGEFDCVQVAAEHVHGIFALNNTKTCHLTRRVSEQSQGAKWEPKRGDAVEGIGHPEGPDAGIVVRGKFERWADNSLPNTAMIVANNDLLYVLRSTLRPLNASGTAEKAWSPFHCLAPGCLGRTHVGDELCPEHLRANPEVKPSVPVRPTPWEDHQRREQSIAAMQANADRIVREQRKRGQAKKQLDVGIGGRRYPYAERSSVFATPGWES